MEEVVMVGVGMFWRAEADKRGQRGRRRTDVIMRSQAVPLEHLPVPPQTSRV